MSVRADAESLRQIPLFRDCDTVPLQVMAFAAERQAFLPGETIIAQGKKATAAYFIMSGAARVLQNDVELGRAQPGSFLGELAMISGALYSVTAIAQDAVTAARIDTALFLRVADEYPDFGRSVLNSIARRLDGSVKELAQIRTLLVRAGNLSDL
ncbi:MAG: cyclic nucleotide-binding domain-containing protein [Rhizobiales bacterium]|nr:cyclic nucleotide-binding domain-containing protein [Hyphomicrobiales bacterium]